ncbi:MAG: ATP-binding protein [Thermodesulfobacteriota bacterium]|nr:ATP-binding protein [Thermodesulfobacteriota bacterium]
MQQEQSLDKIQDILFAFNAITEKIVEYEEELEELLGAILDLTYPILNVSYASILLLDEEKTRFRGASSSGEAPFESDLYAILDISKLLNRSAPDLRNYMLTEIVADSVWPDVKAEDKRFLREVFCSTLLTGQTVIGIACIYGEDLRHGTLESREFSLWAGLASLAIEKSRLNNQVHEKLELKCEELKRAESQLIRSEKLNSLVDIAMNVAHVIRNPVTVIGGLSRRINKNIPSDDPIRKWSDIILSESSKLESIVKDFEAFFSIKEISFDLLDVNQVVEQAADDFDSRNQSNRGVVFERSLCSEPLICYVDTDLIDQCLLHLLTNALEASQNSIHIRLTTYREGNKAIIDVADSGRGISPKQMDHVFDPFYTTKGEGAGMGLTFVHFVITEHSGQVDISSKKDIGTLFRIRLPLQEVHPPSHVHGPGE